MLNVIEMQVCDGFSARFIKAYFPEAHSVDIEYLKQADFSDGDLIVCFYASAAGLVELESGTTSIRDDQLKRWVREAQSLLKLTFARREQVILLDANQLLSDPDAVVDLIKAKGFKPQGEVSFQDDSPAADYITTALKTLAISYNPQINNVFAELCSANSLISNESKRYSIIDNALGYAQTLTDELETATRMSAELESEKSQHEIAVLQIHNLQKELEFYFGQVQELLAKQDSLDAADQVRGFVEARSCVKGVEVQDGFVSENYSELKVKLFEAEMFGHAVGDLEFKVISNCGVTGIELRLDAEEKESWLQWPDDMKDEHGHYFLVLEEPSEYIDDSKYLTYADMRPRDADWVTECLWLFVSRRESVSTIESQPVNTKPWDLRALKLLHGFRAQRYSEIMFEDVQLIESLFSDDYEHLWIKLINVHYGELQFGEVDLKVSTGGVHLKAEDVKEFTIQLRQQELVELFECWPPEEADDYGSIMQLDFYNSADFRNSQVYPVADRLLFLALARSLGAALRLIEGGQMVEGRSLDSWLSIVSKVLDTPPAMPNLGIGSRILRKLGFAKI